MLHYTNLGQEQPASFPGAQVWNEGECGVGNTRIACGQWGAEYRCVACSEPDLSAIKQLQTLLNKVAKLLGSAIVLGADGQVGWRTTEAVGALGMALDARLSQNAVVAAAVASAVMPESPGAIRQVGMAVPELVNYFALAAVVLAGGGNLPDVPVVPVPVVPGPGGDVAVLPPAAYKRRSKQRALIAGLAILTTIGLVGTGIYYQKYYRRGDY